MFESILLFILLILVVLFVITRVCTVVVSSSKWSNIWNNVSLIFFGLIMIGGLVSVVDMIIVLGRFIWAG